MQRSAARVAQLSLWSQRAVLNATYSSPHASKMPLQVKLKLQTEEQTVEFPDNATILTAPTVKEWVYRSSGIPAEQQRIIAYQGGKVLKNEYAVSSDKRFLKLKVVHNAIGGSL